MLELSLAILAMAIVVVWFVVVWFMRRRRSKQARTRAERKESHQRFWGVRVIGTEPAPTCAAMRCTDGRGYRLERVPTLPLPDCDLQICRCRFEYLPERRTCSERRRGQDRRTAIRFDTDRSDRRTGLDRRSANDAWNWTWS